MWFAWCTRACVHVCGCVSACVCCLCFVLFNKCGTSLLRTSHRTSFCMCIYISIWYYSGFAFVWHPQDWQPFAHWSRIPRKSTVRLEPSRMGLCLDSICTIRKLFDRITVLDCEAFAQLLYQSSFQSGEDHSYKYWHGPTAAREKLIYVAGPSWGRWFSGSGGFMLYATCSIMASTHRFSFVGS